MKFSIFSIPDEVKTLAIIDAGMLPQSPKAYLMTDAGKIVTWKFFLEKRDPTIMVSIEEFFEQFKRWMIILCHGGKFAAGFFEENHPVKHKVFARYVVRKKQGMRQSKLFAKGKKALSTGGHFRSEQERKFFLEVNAWLTRHQELVNHCDVLVYHAPGRNRNIIFHEQNLLRGTKAIITSLPFPTTSVSFAEVQRSLHLLTTVEFLHENDD